MTKIPAAHEAELSASSRASHGRTSERNKKDTISHTDIDVIDITDSQESSFPHTDSAERKNRSDQSEINGSTVQKNASLLPAEENNEVKAATNMSDTPDEDIPELLDTDTLQEGELISDDDTFGEPFDEVDEHAQVIDIESNLPAVAQDRLPSLVVRDSLQSYLHEVGKFPLLDPEEETALARRVRDHGDPEAAFRIVSSHLRLVVRIAMDFQRRWMQNVLDLIQEGNVGLLRAVNKFDPDKGIKFSYYASFWIKAYILKFIMDNWRMVKIGTTQAQRKLFYNLNRERQKLILQGFDPDTALLSQRLGVTQDQVVEMQQRLDAGDVSLDLPISDENGSASRMDFLPALGPGVEEDIAGSEMSRLVRNSIHELLPSLSEKEVYILEHRLLTDEPATLREIGERYHVTRERIRQLEARLLEKLKEHLGREIKDFSEEWIQP